MIFEDTLIDYNDDVLLDVEDLLDESEINKNTTKYPTAPIQTCRIAGYMTESSDSEDIDTKEWREQQEKKREKNRLNREKMRRQERDYNLENKNNRQSYPSLKEKQKLSQKKNSFPSLSIEKENFSSSTIISKMKKGTFFKRMIPNLIYANVVQNRKLTNTEKRKEYKTVGIIDTGCENHMTPYKELLIPNSFRDMSKTKSKVSVAEGTETKITGTGTMKIRLENGQIILFENTLLVPALKKTLICPQQLFEKFKCHAKLDLQTFDLCGSTNFTLGHYLNRNYYLRHYEMIKTNNVTISKLPLSQKDYEFIHVVLGHPGEHILNKILTKGLIITGIKPFDDFIENLDKSPKQNGDLKIESSHVSLRRCLICDASKSKKKAFYPSKHQTTHVNEKIGTDLTGPIRTEGINHERYIMILIDYFTKFIELHCLRTKDQWPSTLITALQKRVVKHDSKIKTIRTDNAEMQSNKSIAWLNEQGIEAEYIPPGGDHSEMGGGYERYFLTISTMITAMLLQSNLPPMFWSLAAYHCAKLKNIWHNEELETSPFMVEEKRKPNISQLHPFGCFVIYKNSNDNKILPDGDPAVYVGNKATNIYWVYNIKTKKVDQTAHARFYDNFFPGLKTTNITDLDKLLKNNNSDLSNEDKLEILKLFEQQEDDVIEKKKEKKITQRRTSMRPKLPQNKITQNALTEDKPSEGAENECDTDGDFDVILPLEYDDESEEEVFGCNNMTVSYTYPKPNIPLLEQQILITDMAPLPRGMREAMSRPDAQRWSAANEKEKDAFINKWKVGQPIGKNDMSPNEHIIPTKFVFAYKDHEGYLSDYKVRIVGRGDLMRRDEYEDTFSPVVRIKTQRVLIALATVLGLHIKQFDCENAYLQGKTRRRILIRLPEGWELETKDGELTRIARADKALYGLKESGRDWYITLRDDLIKDGYKQLETDPCVFTKMLGNDLGIISIYVDDGLQICKVLPKMEAEFKRFTERFRARDYRQSDYILSISTERVENGMIIHQSAYAKQILEEFGLWSEQGGTRPTPMSTSYKYDQSLKRLDPKMNTRYRSVIMKLSYLAQQTRADLMYAVNVLAQYQEKPTDNEWKAMVHILRYLKGTWDFGLYYRTQSNDDKLSLITNKDIFPSSREPEGYADASFANEENRKSRSGYLFFMAGAIVTWCSKKQPVISVSSTESELYSLSESTREGIWIRRLLKELQQNLPKATMMNQDNRSSIAIAKNPIHHQRTKHIDVRMNQLRQYLEGKELELQWCPTEDMIADILTKALPATPHKRFTKLMGYISVSELRKTFDINSKSK